MAKRTTTKQKTPKELGFICKDCKHSYEPHSKALDGSMILCRCPFWKYSRFLNRDYCDKFCKK